MNRYILTLILSIVTLCSYGQSGRMIYGCVYGEKKTPLQGAKITTPHGDLICTTDQNGQFNAQCSTYIREIVVLHDDYLTKYVNVDGSYLIIKLRAAVQPYTETTNNKDDAKEEVQTSNLIEEHEARIANKRQAAKEEAQAQAKAEAKKRQEERKAEIAAINKDIAGWKNSIYVNVSSYNDYECAGTPSIGIEYVGGKRFNNAFFLGFGTGVVFNTGSIEPDLNNLHHSVASLPLTRVSIPLYVNMKLYLSRTRWQPYISLSSGFRFSGKRLMEFSTHDLPNYYGKYYYNNRHSLKYGTNQYFITPGFGLDFRFKSGTTLSLQAAFHAITIPYVESLHFVGASQIGITISHRMRPGYHVQIGITF